MAGKQGGAGAKKYGRNKDKCTRYQANHTREKNKVRRVLRASGIEAAREWAAKYGVAGYLESLLKKAAPPRGRVRAPGDLAA